MEKFSSNLKQLRLSKSYKQADIEENIGIKRTAWSNYENGVSTPNIDDLVRISKFFGISESQLLHEDLSINLDIIGSKPDKLGVMITKVDKNIPKKVLGIAKKNTEKMVPKMVPNVVPNSYLSTSLCDIEDIVSEPDVGYAGRQNIILVNQQVAAGFAQIVGKEQQIQALQRFTIPQLAHEMGVFFCFPVSGDSMHPTVKHKEWVIVRQCESVLDIKGGRVYMICTHEGLCLKRLYYKSGEKHIKCVSDNETYSPYKEDVVNLLGIYEAVIHFSDDFRNWNNEVRITLNTAIERITALEKQVFKK